MDTTLIYEKYKAAMSLRLTNNCYDMSTLERANHVWSEKDDFMFSYEDHGIYRIVFFVRSLERLNNLLKQVESGKYYLEFMTKEPNRFVPEDAVLSASMMRIANPDCREIRAGTKEIGNGDCGETATEADANEINGILWSIFRTEISHLLTDEELKEVIKKGHTRIHRDSDGKIDALLQADVMPKKFYINQIVNKGDRRNIHSILQKELAGYVANGGKYLYAWVEDSNIASLKFHEKYGMKHDGMWSMIYSIER